MVKSITDMMWLKVKRALGIPIPLTIVIVVLVLAWEISSVGSSSQAEYVGAKKCKICHLKQYKAWEETSMSKAYEHIANEPDKEKCYVCHTTGYGQPGGFKDAESTPDLKGVQCESCHGPGREHLAVGMTDKAKKRATSERYPTTCSKCHNPHISDKAANAREKK